MSFKNLRRSFQKRDSRGPSTLGTQINQVALLPVMFMAAMQQLFMAKNLPQRCINATMSYT